MLLNATAWAATATSLGDLSNIAGWVLPLCPEIEDVSVPVCSFRICGHSVFCPMLLNGHIHFSTIALITLNRNQLSSH